VGLRGPTKAEWAGGWWTRKNEKWSRGWTGLPKKTGQNQECCRVNIFEFLNQDLSSKLRDSNTSKPKLNWSQTKINLGKPFEYFSNLKILEIGLNIKIQTKALNKRP
jgi:hypothetical protein